MLEWIRRSGNKMEEGLEGKTYKELLKSLSLFSQQEKNGYLPLGGQQMEGVNLFSLVTSGRT